MENSKQIFDQPTFTKKVLIVAGVFIPIILVLLLFGIAFKVLLLILAGVLLASFFRGIASFIHKYTHISLGWSTLISVLLVIGLIVLTSFFIAPQISDQVNQLTQQLPQAIDDTRQQMESSSIGRKIIDQIPDDPVKWMQEKSGMLKKSFGVFASTFGVLADMYIILFIGLFMMAQPEPYQHGIIKLVPISRRGRAEEVLEKLGATLKKWIAGKLFSMLVVAVLTTVGLYILGVPLALSLGIIAGILSFIPNFGPIIALVPAVLIGFMEGPGTALYVALLYIGVQALESNIITPLVQKQMVYLPPAMILISQVLLGILVGGLGLILATPIIAIVMVLINMLYVEDTLGDKSTGKKE
ncbi:AI-2E family transporter [Marivirga sp. S37H4]|uniref:AI-2E family transporter n=1 Tax=Marivirga aurantiaca TaxID=2802615 RepID=A0A934WWK9_9BACT|nr:AI-2E family transporter [Marivirga aurantiaca]MBK6264261.1 AI-2E family transporter [Marivirga aurantiaca]